MRRGLNHVSGSTQEHDAEVLHVVRRKRFARPQVPTNEGADLGPVPRVLSLLVVAMQHDGIPKADTIKELKMA